MSGSDPTDGNDGLDAYLAAAAAVAALDPGVVDELVEWARAADPAPAWLCDLGDLGEHDGDLEVGS
jgi:hypothetical protein